MCCTLHSLPEPTRIASEQGPCLTSEQGPCLTHEAIAVLMQGGVWVLGMIKGGAADRAGIRQGDEILKVDGQEISSLSPFKVAGLLQGADGESDSDSFVELEVRLFWSLSHVSLQCLLPDQEAPCIVWGYNTRVFTGVKTHHVGICFLFHSEPVRLHLACIHSTRIGGFKCCKGEEARRKSGGCENRQAKTHCANACGGFSRRQR